MGFFWIKKVVIGPSGRRADIAIQHQEAHSFLERRCNEFYFKGLMHAI
jgi:hypothetical protein